MIHKGLELAAIVGMIAFWLGLLWRWFNSLPKGPDAGHCPLCGKLPDYCECGREDDGLWVP